MSSQVRECVCFLVDTVWTVPVFVQTNWRWTVDVVQRSVSCAGGNRHIRFLLSLFVPLFISSSCARDCVFMTRDMLRIMAQKNLICPSRPTVFLFFHFMIFFFWSFFIFCFFCSFFLFSFFFFSCFQVCDFFPEWGSGEFWPTFKSFFIFQKFLNFSKSRVVFSICFWFFIFWSFFAFSFFFFANFLSKQKSKKWKNEKHKDEKSKHRIQKISNISKNFKDLKDSKVGQNPPDPFRWNNHRHEK